MDQNVCGRYTQTKDGEYVEQYFEPELVEGTVEPRFNVAPGQHAPVGLFFEEKKLLTLFRWGLVPMWAKEESVGYKMINARAETVAEKPSFKRLLNRRRCLVFADGFYEWQKVEGSKQKRPFRFTLQSKEAFAFAGLWDIWRSPQGADLFTYTIITTEANGLVSPVHHRMPVILSKGEQDTWLDPDRVKARDVLPLLKPFPQEGMDSYEVSTVVNSPRNDSEECIEAVA